MNAERSSHGVLLCGVFLLFISSGCAFSVHEVHVGGFDSNVDIRSAKPIESNSEQFVILGFTGNTDYVEEARARLEAKCKGRINGITTRYSTALGFLSWTNKIRMTGYCS